MALLVLSFPVSPSMGRKKCSKACASSQGWAKGQPCPQGTGRALPAPLRGLALKGRPSAVPGPREPSTCFCPPCQRQEALRAQRPPVWGSAELVPGLEGRAEHSAAQGGNAASARSPRTRLSHAGPPREVQLGKRRVIRILSGRASTKAESRDSARSCASPFTAASCTAAQLGKRLPRPPREECGPHEPRTSTRPGKGRNSGTCYLEDVMLRETSESQKARYCVSPRMRGTKAARPTETERGRAIAKGWGAGG